MTKKIIILTTLGLISTTMATSVFDDWSVFDPRDTLTDLYDRSTSIGELREMITTNSALLGPSDRFGTLALISTDDHDDATENTMTALVGITTAFENASVNIVYDQTDFSDNGGAVYRELYVNGEYDGLEWINILSELLHFSSDADDETESFLKLDVGSVFDAFTIDAAVIIADATDENGDDDLDAQAIDLLARYAVTDNITVRANIMDLSGESEWEQVDQSYMLLGAESAIDITDNITLNVMGNIGTSEINEVYVDDASGDDPNFEEDNFEEDLMQMAASITYVDKENGRLLTAEVGQAVAEQDEVKETHQKLDVDASAVISENIMAAAYLGIYDNQKERATHGDSEYMITTIGAGLSVNYDDITGLLSIRFSEIETGGAVVVESTDLGLAINYAF